MQEFSEFLSWLIFGGGSVLCSSWILERVAWFQRQTTEAKKTITFSMASILAVGAHVLVTFAPEFVVAAQPYFFILSGTFMLVFLQNVFHRYDKELPKG